MKGFWYIVEAVLAAIIILGFLLAISGKYIDQGSVSDVSLKGYSILKSLDERDVLRNYTVNLDYNGLNSEIRLFTYNHSIQICDFSGSCVGERPNITDLWVASYIISGDSQYQPYEVKLYIYGKS
jgi:uncharacterized membrane-anchored protein